MVGKQGTIVVECIVVLGRGTDNSCREDMTSNTDLPDGMPGLVEVDRSEDEHSPHSSEPLYSSYDPLLLPYVPSPSQMSYPPFSRNSRNPHWILSIEY